MAARLTGRLNGIPWPMFILMCCHSYIKLCITNNDNTNNNIQYKTYVSVKVLHMHEGTVK